MIRFQMDLMRAAKRRDAGSVKPFNYYYCEFEKDVAITDGYSIKIIDKKDLYIDIEKVFQGKTFKCEEMVKDRLNAVALKLKKKIVKGKDVILCLESYYGKTVYINEKFVKPNNPEFVTFKLGTGYNDCIVHLEDPFDNYLGCVLIIKNFNEED